MPSDTTSPSLSLITIFSTAVSEVSFAVTLIVAYLVNTKLTLASGPATKVND